jgi:thioredoxin-related protein
MKPLSNRIFLLSLALVGMSAVAACGGPRPAPGADAGSTTPPKPTTAIATPAKTAEAGDDLPWFRGSVEEAFALAKRERRPVFLYWGAVWCPPCHALRTKLFTRPEFRSRIAAAVAVYLDGDTERAQIWGEKLGTQGYPTVIVFDPDGHEITRLDSSLPFEQYADVLSRALDAARPISAILADAERSGPGSLSAPELHLLAFYAYDQDSVLNLTPERRRALFDRFRRETPAEHRLEKSRFLALDLEAWAEAAGESPAHAPSDAARAELAAALPPLLADRELRNSNLALVLYDAGDVVRMLTPQPGPERDALIADWNGAARQLEDDADLTTDDRLSALMPQIELARLAAGGTDDSAPLPAALLDRVRERIRWAGGQVHDEDEMQAVMSTMTGLLQDAGLVDEAKTLLADKLGETAAPYYYRGWLAGLEARTGHPQEAVADYREAWQGARGAAGPGGAAMTPFRWGSNYLRQAMKLTPDSPAIATDADTILDDLLSSPDAFSLGNWSRLETLATAFETWRGTDAARGTVVDKVAARVHAVCGKFPGEGEDSPAARCASLFGPKT